MVCRVCRFVNPARHGDGGIINIVVEARNIDIVSIGVGMHTVSEFAAYPARGAYERPCITLARTIFGLRTYPFIHRPVAHESQTIPRLVDRRSVRRWCTQ